MGVVYSREFSVLGNMQQFASSQISAISVWVPHCWSMALSHKGMVEPGEPCLLESKCWISVITGSGSGGCHYCRNLCPILYTILVQYTRFHWKRYQCCFTCSSQSWKSWPTTMCINILPLWRVSMQWDSPKGGSHKLYISPSGKEAALSQSKKNKLYFNIRTFWTVGLLQLLQRW